MRQRRLILALPMTDRAGRRRRPRRAVAHAVDRRHRYPLVLPSIRDPRLHVAAVIITIHVLGQVGLGFAVSVPQILAAILTCAVLEVAITFRQTKAFVWPASAMLTGSGVALILRVVGTPPGEPWNTGAWYVFAAVAGLSLLSKYVIKYRGSTSSTRRTSASSSPSSSSARRASSRSTSGGRRSTPG